VRFVIFTHSLVSDWNHGNAHFLRGFAWDLMTRGHEVRIFEPQNGWSLKNLLRDHGPEPIAEFRAAYPGLCSTFYDLETLHLDQELKGADVVNVHEWNPTELVRWIGEHHAASGSYRLFFHDTHHRSATDPSSMAQYDLRHYDGVLAYGAVIRDLYLRNGWAKQAWVWHEAADTRRFRPLEMTRKEGDLVWVGNWGDGERGEELREFLIRPVKALGLKARVYGVRYPADALEELKQAGIEYGGWLPNFRVPEVFARYRVTVHVPRRPYVQALPGIPTIRPFEALACGIPLVSAPWDDSEALFRRGRDLLFARDGAEMTVQLRHVLEDAETAQRMAASGVETIRKRHTCAHRVEELMSIAEDVNETAMHGGAR
jgi:spore maturation protein CgeB